MGSTGKTPRKTARKPGVLGDAARGVVLGGGTGAGKARRVVAPHGLTAAVEAPWPLTPPAAPISVQVQRARRAPRTASRLDVVEPAAQLADGVQAVGGDLGLSAGVKARRTRPEALSGGASW